jgi:hypothetical protein
MRCNHLNGQHGLDFVGGMYSVDRLFCSSGGLRSSKCPSLNSIFVAIGVAAFAMTVRNV